MSNLEIEYKLEIIRLTALCRYAASELRALDDIIAQRHPMSSGLPSELVESLDGQKRFSFVNKYKDLQEAESELLSMLEKTKKNVKGFEDLEIEAG